MDEKEYKTEALSIPVVDISPKMEQPNEEISKERNAQTAIIPFQKASLLTITEEENKILEEDFDENQIQIRPDGDGLVYLEQVFYRDRLNHAFGRGQWVVIPVNVWTQGDIFYYLGDLYIRGFWQARACGAHMKRERNKMQTWADCYESAKSDCITRCCKDLGIFKKLWSKDFTNAWKEKYAIKVYKHEENRWYWRRKNDEPFWWEKKQFKKNETIKEIEPQKEPAFTDLSEKEQSEILIRKIVVGCFEIAKAQYGKDQEARTQYAQELLKKFSTYKNDFAIDSEKLKSYSVKRLSEIYENYKNFLPMEQKKRELFDQQKLNHQTS